MSNYSTWRLGTIIAIVAGAAGLSVGLAGPATGQSAATPQARATSVAVVSISRVLQGLNEREDKEAELAAIGKTREDTVNGIGDKAKAALADLDVLAKGTPDWKAKREEAMRLDAQFRLEKEIATRILGDQQKTMQLALFNKILDAVKTYAEHEGLDLVLTNDSGAEISPDLQDQQFMAAVTGRRVAYASDTVDITDEVTLAMNNQYKAP